MEAVGSLEAGEFWVSNVWRYPPDKNLSAFEPNRVLLNCGGLQFIDAHYVSSGGSEGDGRAAMVADVNDDLQPDVLVRQVGGGPLKVYLNRFPPTSRLIISLRGTKSNSMGIGARVVCEVSGRRLERQLYANNSVFAQQGARVRFGLGEAKTVDRLTVHWPSGGTTELENVAVDRHLLIHEGSTEPTVLRGATR